MEMSDLTSSQHEELTRRALTDVQRYADSLMSFLQQVPLTDQQTAELAVLHRTANDLVGDDFVPDDMWIASRPLPSASDILTPFGPGLPTETNEALAVLSAMVEVLDMLNWQTHEQYNDLEVLEVMEVNLAAYRLKDSLLGSALASYIAG